MSEPINGDELLAKIKPKLRTIRTQVCLRPDLLEDWQDASDALAALLESAGAGRLNGGDTKAVKDAQKLLDKIEAEIDEVSPWFEFEAMPIEKYQALCAGHPPREDDQFDLYAGHNRDAVLNELVRKCLVSPAFSDAGWAAFLETCAPSEWSELSSVALEVNGGSVKPPKSRPGSRRLSAPASVSE